MAPQSWERLYLDALLRSNSARIKTYESLEFFSTVAHEPHSGVQELLLHRTIPVLRTIEEAVQLINIVRSTELASYGPRILARISDTEAVLKHHPELDEHLESLRRRTGYTTSSLKDWRMLNDGTRLVYRDAPVWTGRSTSILDIVEEPSLTNFGIAEISAVLDHFIKRGFRVFQIALLTFSAVTNQWAQTLHRVLSAPYFEIEPEEQHGEDSFAEISPSPQWAPHWKTNAMPENQPRWKIYEAHTTQEIHGIASTTFFDQISVLLALTGLLREGINLSPLDRGLVRSQTPSHPIWGFRRRDFSAARTTYQDSDVRALALGFLENVSPNRRVSVFRSRLALHFASRSWRHRASASVVTSTKGFYQQFLSVAQLLDQNQFHDVLQFVKDSEYGTEPAFQLLAAEATVALELFDRLERLQYLSPTPGDGRSDAILCVTHASVPHQTGGYAIRAHGILKSLQNQGVSVVAVTRPGFPDGAMTERSVEVEDEVTYHRLPAPSVTRSHGEIQYMMSFIEPFKEFFRTQDIGVVHARSTFLIALPALIAARELGLKVLYEVSGLWELVYQDREHESQFLKRSSFAELAETITMQQADQLVVMNDAVREIAIDRGVDSSKIQVAHNAVDVDSFTPLVPPQDDIFTIGYLGSFQDYEGLEDIIDVVKLLQEQETPVRVLMVGDGLGFNPIHARIVNEGLQESVSLTGRVPHSKVREYYEQMDVLVYPRLSTGATETITPLKPFEALALAKPIVVSDVAPLKEIVGENERGLVFESGNIQDFARVILQLQQDRDLGKVLGQAGRTWVVEHRNWGNVVEIFIDAYKKLH